MNPLWKLALRLAIYLACCVALGAIAMIAFPNHTDRIIPAFFGLAFIGVFFSGIFGAFLYLRLTEQEDRKAATSQEPVARPLKRASAWFLIGIGALFILRGLVALAYVLSRGRWVTPTLAGMIEDGIFGGAAIFFGFRVRSALGRSGAAISNRHSNGPGENRHENH